MKKRIIWVLALGLLGLAGRVGKADGTGEQELNAARQALAVHQFRGWTGLLRRALVNAEPGGPVEKQALQMMDEVSTKTNGHAVYPNFLLPEGMPSVEVLSNRVNHASGTVFQVMVRMTVRDGEKPKGVEMHRQDGTVLMDTAVGRGSLVEKKPDYWVAMSDVPESALRPGLFQLNFALASGEAFAPWFITSRFEASAAPVIMTPECQSFSSAPKLNWQEFRSPEWQNFESRKIEFSVPAVFDGTLSSPDLTSIRFGQGELSTIAQLSDGSHSYMVGYVESRFFGPLLLSRASRTMHRFVMTQPGETISCF